MLNLKKESRITITGRNVQGSNTTTAHYSINFLALLNKIKMLNYVESGIKELCEVTMPMPTDLQIQRMYVHELQRGRKRKAAKK